MQSDTVTIRAQKLFIKTAEGKKVTRDAGLLDEMYRQELSPLSDGVAFPDGTKFIARRGSMTVVVHEQKPQIRQLRWNRRNVHLSLPYTIMITRTFVMGDVHHLSNAYLYFANKPLKDFKSQLSFPALPNVLPGEHAPLVRLCLPGSMKTSGRNLASVLREVLTSTWNSNFNRDGYEASSHHLRYADDERFNPRRWGELTKEYQKKDKSFALSVDWKPAGTVGQIMNKIMGSTLQTLTRPHRPPAGVIQRIVKYAKV